MSLACVFPGQGSQSVGMLGDLAIAEPLVEQTFADASEVLGYDLWDLVKSGPEESLNSTDRTQPALLTAGVAVWRIWQAHEGTQPAFMAGHSLGEYTALVCAGALDFSDAVKLVARRGEFMQQAVPEGEGSMAAIIGLDDESVREACRESENGGVVEAVNFNAPGQVVIAGSTSAVDRAIEHAEESGAKRAILLPVSVPSHCALMKPAADQLADLMNGIEFRAPGIPVIHNVDVLPHSDANDIRRLLAEQLHNPVRWVDTIQAMAGLGVDAIIECGPGKVLSGLNRRIDRAISALPVFDADSLEKALSE